MCYAQIFSNFHEYWQRSKQWSGVKLSQRFSNYAIHKPSTLTRFAWKWGSMVSKKFIHPKVQPMPAGCGAEWGGKGRFWMAPGFAMDALHSCNDEWVRRVKNESSVGGGNICRACHSQGRKSRGLSAWLMGNTSRFPGHGPCLFIYFSSWHIPFRRAKNWNWNRYRGFWKQGADCGWAAELSCNLLPNVWVPLGFPQLFYGPFSKIFVKPGQQRLHPLPHQWKAGPCFRAM